MCKRMLLAGLVGLLLWPGSQLLAQARVVQGGNYQGGWQSSYTMGWLRNEQMRKELEIVDYQVEKIEKLQTKLQEDVRELYADIRELPRQEQAEKYREAQEKVRELYADAEKELGDILLPQQVERLEQVMTQMRMRGGMSYGLQGDLAKTLEITEEQQKQLREKAAAKNQELYKKYAELRREMQQELLEEVLTEKQQKQLDELIGEPFEFQYQYGSGRVGAGGTGGVEKK